MTHITYQHAAHGGNRKTNEVDSQCYDSPADGKETRQIRQSILARWPKLALSLWVSFGSCIYIYIFIYIRYHPVSWNLESQNMETLEVLRLVAILRCQVGTGILKKLQHTTATIVLSHHITLENLGIQVPSTGHIENWRQERLDMNRQMFRRLESGPDSRTLGKRVRLAYDCVVGRLRKSKHIKMDKYGWSWRLSNHWRIRLCHGSKIFVACTCQRLDVFVFQLPSAWNSLLWFAGLELQGIWRKLFLICFHCLSAVDYYVAKGHDLIHIGYARSHWLHIGSELMFHEFPTGDQAWLSMLQSHWPFL